MKISKSVIAKHIILIIGITLFLILVIVYPFLPGKYDPLALPISTMVQLLGVVGLPFVLPGFLWLIMPGRRFAFAISSVIVASVIALILALFATLSVGNSFGFIVLVIGVCIIVRLASGLPPLKNAGLVHFNATPVYLIALPVLTLIFQLAVATPITKWSMDRAISKANEFLLEIEEYKTQHGHYPVSLQAQHKDYNPDVVGVEKYFYAPQGKGYNLFFEQPRFLLDRFGTREWIVYNPLDEHSVFSHTAWLLLAPQTTGSAQGWYASGNTRHLHWKYFWFD